MSDLTPRAFALSELIITVFRSNGALLAAGDELARPSGLTSARWQVLGVVDEEARTVAEVARIMGLRRQSVLQTADALVRDGFVVYQDNPRHKRAKLIEATEAGRRAMAEVERRHAEWADRLAARFEPARVASAKAVLDDLAALLESETEGREHER